MSETKEATTKQTIPLDNYTKVQMALVLLESGTKEQQIESFKFLVNAGIVGGVKTTSNGKIELSVSAPIYHVQV